MTEINVLPKKISEEEYLYLEDSYSGLCLSCGEVQEGDVEGDATGYECHSCGESSVEGIQNCLMSGDIVIIEYE